MTQQEPQSRLSRISTLWTMVAKGVGGPESAQAEAQRRLLERYHQAVFRYLLGSLRNQDLAEEVFQNFALKFLRGDFRNAEASRGNFRSYLKTALARLIVDHFRAERRKSRAGEGALAEVVADGDVESIIDNLDEEFLGSWREEILSKAWNALRQLQSEGGRPLFSVLKYRSQYPAAPSARMARDLTAALALDTPLTDTAVRKSLQKARERFAEILVDEVESSLDGSPKNLRDELDALDLLRYCRSAVERRGR